MLHAWAANIRCDRYCSNFLKVGVELNTLKEEKWSRIVLYSLLHSIYCLLFIFFSCVMDPTAMPAHCSSNGSGTYFQMYNQILFRHHHHIVEGLRRGRGIIHRRNGCWENEHHAHATAWFAMLKATVLVISANHLLALVVVAGSLVLDRIDLASSYQVRAAVFFSEQTVFLSHNISA